jgi:nucleoside-diphosphate-sugar epimerase
MTENDWHTYYHEKKIVITGGAGYLASSIIRILQNVDCRITRIDRSEASFEPICGKSYIKDICTDITNTDLWKDVIPGTDIIFHLAAQTSANLSNEKPLLDLSINAIPLLHILEECRRSSNNLILLFAGTVTQAGMPTILPVNESHPDRPITIYDIHKLMAEKYIEIFTEMGFVQGAVLRLSNVYGPGPSSSSADRGILNGMIQKALKGEPLTMYGRGEWLRDYLYVEDAAEAFLLAGAHIDSVKGQHFVVGSGKGHSLHDAFHLVAERVTAKAGLRVKVVQVAAPSSLLPIETRQFVADPTKFKRATGWLAQYSLKDGIDRTIEHYLNSTINMEKAIK